MQSLSSTMYSFELYCFECRQQFEVFSAEFKFNTIHLNCTVFDCRQECEVVNAELATVFTLEEHTTFFKTAREQNTSVWVGLKTKEIVS